MSDRLDTKMRALTVALVDEAPDPHAFGDLPLGQPKRASLSRNVRALVAAACVVVLAVGAVAIARTLGGDTKGDPPVNSQATRKALVGESATVGPLRVRVKYAISTVTPHTYVLTMSITNRGAKPSPLPRLELGCKTPLSPLGFGITGFVISDEKLAPHESRSGDVTLYPQQICENPTVTISRHLVKGPRDEVTYVLRGLI